MPLTLFVAVAMLSGAPDFEVTTARYREIDGASQILYLATCVRRQGQPSTCTLKSATVSTDKSPIRCQLTVQTLFEDEVAQNPQKETFIVSVSRGACGYTNTYVMSSTGLVQTKTSPPKAAPTCEAFPPKTYQASVFEGDRGSSFYDVPIGGCKAMNVRLD